jgi:DNA-directed RNA polymerase subunit RPC12/RpoP
MGMLSTVREVLQASTESANRSGDGGDPSTGAYWCHDCSERVLDTEVEGEAAPDCPDCGDAMTFERSPDATGCAC